MLKTSKRGINLISSWEKFRALPYMDSAGVWTIGYGHTHGITSDSKEITRTEAIAILMKDIAHVEMYVNSIFSGLKQEQFDAVVALLFNIGVGGLYKKDGEPTSLYRLLKEDKDSKHIADEWIEFRNAGGKYLRGLLRRRLDELSLYYSW